MNSPYLEAIQKIDGSTPGEKYKTLNEKARAIIASKANEIDPLDNINSFDIPEPLLPIVRVEVSKILRKPDGIIEALKSEDSLVFDRALKAKWFFDGTNEIINVHYYDNHIFPHVSLNNRIRIVKTLASHLSSCPKKSSIADEFYEVLCKKYCEKMAEPLLSACSGSFLRKIVIEERKIDPTCRLIKIIYQKYPKLIIDYLKLSKSDAKPYERNLHKISIDNFVSFLPQLVKNNVNDFIEIIELQEHSFNIKFSKTRSELFMKYGIDAIVRNPNLFLPMMSLKQVTDKLTAIQYKLMFKNLFPEKIENCNASKMLSYLEFYTENNKIDVLLATFEEVYGKSLLDTEENLDKDIFRLLSPEERVRQARKRLAKDSDWRLTDTWNFEMSWRCYLLTSESIPAIKNQIQKTSNPSHRLVLLQQMIFTCWINSDLDALLETLKYIATRHKNEQSWVLLSVIDRFLSDFKDVTLTFEHWEVLNNFIQRLFVKNDYSQNFSTFRDLIAAGIRFNLVNKLPISEKMDVFIEANGSHWNSDWNILKDRPEYERMCLDYVLERIPQKYSETNKIGSSHWSTTVRTLIGAISDFNARNLKNPKTNLENVSLKKYPSLIEAVKRIFSDKEEQEWVKQELARILKEADADVYKECVPEKDRDVDAFDVNVAVLLLKKEPQKIKDDWEKYLSECTTRIEYNAVQRFVKSCRWHQDLPIKFAEKSLDNFTSKKEANSLILLALLYEGSTFERLIAPFIPKDSTRNVEGGEAKMDYMIESAITTSFTVVEPPISLDLFFDFCQGDHLHTALTALMNLGRRVSVDKVIEFAMKFMDKPVSMKKHGIRLFYLVSTMDEIRRMSMDLLRNEKHRSIRTIVFDKIRQLFIDEPTEETWTMIREAIVDLKPDDDAVVSFVQTEKVANEFINDYMRLLLDTIKRLEGMVDGLDKSKASTHYCTLIHASIDATKYLSEEFHEYILQEYFTNLEITDRDLCNAIRGYVIDGYLIPADEKFEVRLKHITKLLSDMIEKHWNVMNVKRPGCLPGNYMLHSFIDYIASCTQFSATVKKIMEAIYETVFSILKPQQAPTSYLYLTYGTLLQNDMPPIEFGRKIHEALPSMIEALSSESISMMAKILHEFLITATILNVSILDIVETLLEYENDCSTIFASMLLFYDSKIKNDVRFWRIAEILREHKHPAVVSNIYMCINCLSVNDENIE